MESSTCSVDQDIASAAGFTPLLCINPAPPLIFPQHSDDHIVNPLISRCPSSHHIWPISSPAPSFIPSTSPYLSPLPASSLPSLPLFHTSPHPYYRPHPHPPPALTSTPTSPPPSAPPKRDWLSSLSRTSPSSCFTPPDPAPSAVIPPVNLSSTSLSSPPTLRLDELPGMASHGQHCKALDSKFSNPQAHQENIPLGISGGTNNNAQATATAFRLSTVMAALQAGPVPDPAPRLHSEEIRGSPVKQPGSSRLESREKEPRKSRKVGKFGSASASKMIEATTALQCQVMDQTQKADDFGWVDQPGSKREVHIYAERERRRGMSHAYATLRSLLPKDKMKVDRCTLLTDAMQHIQDLLEELDELSKQKAEVLASRQKCDVQVNLKEIATKTISESSTEEYASSAHSNYNLEVSHHKVTENVDYDNEEIVATHTRPTSEIRDASLCNEHLSKKTNQGHVSFQEDDGVPHIINDVHVGVRFFGEDAFITVCTLNKRGSWSSLLEGLQQFGIQIHNVTLSTSPNSSHHCIHAKVPTGFQLKCNALQQCLKEHVSQKQK